MMSLSFMLFHCLTAGGTKQEAWQQQRWGRGGMLAGANMDVNNAGLKILNLINLKDKHIVFM